MQIEKNTPLTTLAYKFKHVVYPYLPFVHQREVFESISQENILLQSPTSSGKTAAVVYPILDQIKDTNGRALFVYPTRALLWDQLQAIEKVASSINVKVAKISPFTPTKDLYQIFAGNRVIVMTPDIFYFTLLRNAQHYKRFYERSIESIQHIVFDEVHLYDTYMLFNLKNLLKVIREINPEIRIHCLSATVEHIKRELEDIINFKVIKGEGFTGDVSIRAVILPNFELTSGIQEALEKKGRKVIILNSAKRAQEVYDLMKEKYSEVFYAVGQRFQLEEGRNKNLAEFSQKGNAILVASPTVEQGLDFRAEIVISEDVNSLPSIIQRFGRIGRGGEKGEFLVLVKRKDLEQFYNQEQTVTRSQFESFLADPQKGKYYNPPRSEELEMMEAMLWKVWKQTEFKNSFEKVHNLSRLEKIYHKYEKHLPDVSFREPQPGIELKTGNLVSIWDCLKRDIWKRLCPHNEKTATGYLPISADDFWRSEFEKYHPSIKLISWERYGKDGSCAMITGEFEIRGIKFKANGVIYPYYPDIDAFRVSHKNQTIYFIPKTFFNKGDNPSCPTLTASS